MRIWGENGVTRICMHVPLMKVFSMNQSTFNNYINTNHFWFCKLILLFFCFHSKVFCFFYFLKKAEKKDEMKQTIIGKSNYTNSMHKNELNFFVHGIRIFLLTFVSMFSNSQPVKCNRKYKLTNYTRIRYISIK